MAHVVVLRACVRVCRSQHRRRRPSSVARRSRCCPRVLCCSSAKLSVRTPACALSLARCCRNLMLFGCCGCRQARISPWRSVACSARAKRCWRSLPTASWPTCAPSNVPLALSSCAADVLLGLFSQRDWEQEKSSLLASYSKCVLTCLSVGDRSPGPVTPPVVLRPCAAQSGQ